VTTEIDRLVAFFETGIPFNAHLGMKVEQVGDGSATIRIPFRDNLIGDPGRPAIHGGVLSALADTTGGLAVFSVLGPKGRTSTVDLRVDYLRPGLAKTCSAMHTSCAAATAWR
jgi:uncharacterized protein (TIGR00369 family)